MAGRSEFPFMACASALLTLIRPVVLVSRSRMTTSSKPVVSPATRLDAVYEKVT
jgi:hypothetical protein